MAMEGYWKKSVWLILGLWVHQLVALQLDLDQQDSIRSAAKTVAYGMQTLYNGNTSEGVLGKWPFMPYYWWESGAAWGAMVNYWYYTGDASWNAVTLQGLESQISSTNDFMPPAEEFDLGNDDQAFWTFAALSAAELGFPEPTAPYPSWLTICENVFNDFVSRWDMSSCGGGLKWQIFSKNAGYTYKNSISAGGFFQVSARLARLTGNQTYIDWATKVWDWTQEVGLIDDQYHVYDGSDSTINCTQINHLQWSYNVGVYLYGAALLQNLTSSSLWTTRTNGLLGDVSLFLTPYSNASGILFEPECETIGNCNTDQLSMKAYLARWLAETSRVATQTSDRIRTILRTSAQGAATACSGGSDGTTCGFKWYVGGWDGTTGLGQQLDALDSFLALLVMDSKSATVQQALQTQTTSSSSTKVSTSSTTSSTTTSTKHSSPTPSSSSTHSPVKSIAIVHSSSTNTSTTPTSTSTSTSIFISSTASSTTISTSTLLQSTASDTPGLPLSSPSSPISTVARATPAAETTVPKLYSGGANGLEFGLSQWMIASIGGALLLILL